MAVLICMVAVCPIRAEATHRSEQTSQLLFGEMCELLEKEKDFVRIRVIYDDYEGWCQLTQLAETSHETLTKENKLAGEWINQISINDELMNIPFGSSLAFLEDEKEITVKNKIVYKGRFIYPAKDTIHINLFKTYAFTFLNVPYLWGGRSVFGIDCSGFTQLVFKCVSIQLLRDANQQATQGEQIEFLANVNCGDLAFFDNETGKITHVGILLDPHTIIHASGKVRIDTINNLGIINSDNGNRTHKLKIIKRVIN